MEVLWGTDEDLLKRFCAEIETKLYRPKVIIDYERRAYIEPITNVRITFDMNISASNDFEHFTKGKYVIDNINEKDIQILEGAGVDLSK